MAQDKDRSPKRDPMERAREASARTGVPFEDVTEEQAGRRTLILGFGGRARARARARARGKRPNGER
jgi:hypothetical protein